jgi:hypothetical protein
LPTTRNRHPFLAPPQQQQPRPTQQAQNVWRKRAYQAMQRGFAKFGHAAMGTSADAESVALLHALDVFRQRVDHSVENTVPQGLKYSEKIGAMVAEANGRGLLQVLNKTKYHILRSTSLYRCARS